MYSTAYICEHLHDLYTLNCLSDWKGLKKFIPRDSLNSSLRYILFSMDTTDAVRLTIWIYMLCRRFFICLRNICLMYNYRIYNNLFWIFLIHMEFPSAKHTYSYGRANRVTYISLLFLTPWLYPYTGITWLIELRSKIIQTKVLTSKHYRDT